MKPDCIGAAYLPFQSQAITRIMYWLGIDIGTGGTRALLVDERGAVKASYTAAHEEMRMERPLWAEQRPENWWDAAQQAIRGVLREAGARAMRSRVSGYRARCTVSHCSMQRTRSFGPR